MVTIQPSIPMTTMVPMISIRHRGRCISLSSGRSGDVFCSCITQLAPGQAFPAKRYRDPITASAAGAFVPAVRPVSASARERSVAGQPR